jgi:hypothetical protein
MKEFPAVLGAAIQTLGYYSAGDGGDGLYVVEAGDSGNGFDRLVVGDNTAVLQLKNNTLNVKAIGAKGNGVDDDYAALFYALNSSNLQTFIPKSNGDYVSNTLLRFSALENAYIRAEKGATIRSDHANTVLEFRECSNIRITDLQLDGDSFVGGAGSHGLVLYRCSDSEIERCKVIGVPNTCILVFTEDSDPRSFGVTLRDNYTVGGQNGQSIVRMDSSSIINGRSFNITGSPGYGLQLKNECRRCAIIGGTVDGASGEGFVFGLTSTLGVSNSVITGGSANNCRGLLAIGNAVSNSISGLQGSNFSGVGITTEGVSRGNKIDAVVTNCQDSVVRYKDTSNSNDVSVLSRGTSGNQVILYESGTANNSSNIIYVENITDIASPGLSDDENLTDTGNRSYYKKSGSQSEDGATETFITHDEKYVPLAGNINITFDAAPPTDGYFIDGIQNNRFRINFVGSAYTGDVFWSFE